MQYSDQEQLSAFTRVWFKKTELVKKFLFFPGQILNDSLGLALLSITTKQQYYSVIATILCMMLF
jgi:hypothetical protein